nr:hypothetical protein [Tanacetum cinerariifolium]
NSLNDSPSISETSSQSPSNINHCCYECGDPLDGIFCKRCTLIKQSMELPQALPIFHPTFHSEAESPFTLDSTPTYVDESHNVSKPPPQSPVYPCEFCENDAYYGHYCTHQAPFIYSEPCYNQDFNFLQNFQNVPQQYPCCDDCRVTHDAYQFTPTEPIDSLSMGDEHLDTIPATKSDEFIKSCVENLVPNPSESEGENEYVQEKIYSNPLFDEEIIPIEIDQHSFNAESDLIDSMHNHDSSITISSKFDSLFDEFVGEITLLKSFSPRIDETDCHHEKEIRLAKRLLYDNSSPRPSEEIVSDNSNADIESFSPSHIPNEDSDSLMEEIDLSFNLDDLMPPGIEDDDYDSGRDIPILEEVLNSYSLSLPASKSYHFHIPSPYRPPAKPPDANTGTLNIKMMGDVSERQVPIPNLTITCVLNQKKSPDLLSHLGFKAF